MNDPLLSSTTTLLWVVQDFWLSLVAAVTLLLYRIAHRARDSAGEGLLTKHRERYRQASSSSASVLPFLLWGLEANALQRVIYATHASTQPRMLLGSMQEMLAAVVLLAILGLLDWAGRGFTNFRSGFSIGSAGVVGAVLADWLLSQIGWWTFIARALP